MEADIIVIKADAELEKEKAMSEEENLSDDDIDQSKAKMVELWKEGTPIMTILKLMSIQYHMSIESPEKTNDTTTI